MCGSDSSFLLISLILSELFSKVFKYLSVGLLSSYECTCSNIFLRKVSITSYNQNIPNIFCKNRLKGF